VPRFDSGPSEDANLALKEGPQNSVELPQGLPGELDRELSFANSARAVHSHGSAQSVGIDDICVIYRRDICSAPQ